MTDTLDQVDLLAQLERQLRAARAAVKRKETLTHQQKRTGLTQGQPVRTNCPRSPRFHARSGTVVGKANLGEIGVSFNRSDNPAAYFLPSELIKQ